MLPCSVIVQDLGEGEIEVAAVNPVESMTAIQNQALKPILNEVKEMLEKAIEKLSPAYRTVFNLYVIEERSHKEIAAILGISEGTSKSNLAKAKMNLQRLLKEQFILIEKR